MNNGDVQSKTELLDADSSQDTTLNKYSTVRNAAISFWAMLALYFIFESYAPVSSSSNSTYYILAANLSEQQSPFGHTRMLLPTNIKEIGASFCLL